MSPGKQAEHDLAPKRRKPFYGWWVAVAAGIGLGLGYGPIIVYTFTIFLKPLLQHFHSSRGEVSFAFTLANVAVAISSPLAGRLADRFGGKRIIFSTTCIFAVILVSALVLSNGIWKLYLFYVLLGTFGAGTANVPYGKVVSNWFDKRRGLALGLMMSGLGVGAIVLPPLAQHLITIFGWRGAYAAIGLLATLLCLPVVNFLLKETPAEVGSLPDGGATKQAAMSQRADSEGVSWYDAWHDRAFWIMASAFVLVGASVHGCVIHMVPMLTDRGITADQAALASSLLGAAILISRLVSGYLLDRFFAPRVAMFFFCAAGLGIGLLWSGASGASAYLGAFLVGLGMGAEGDVIAYLTGRFFGLRSFGEIYGYAFASYVLAGALGPWLMGFGFDHTASYRPVLSGFFAATLVAGAVTLRLGPYRYRPH